MLILSLVVILLILRTVVVLLWLLIFRILRVALLFDTVLIVFSIKLLLNLLFRILYFKDYFLLRINGLELSRLFWLPSLIIGIYHSFLLVILWLLFFELSSMVFILTKFLLFIVSCSIKIFTFVIFVFVTWNLIK